MKKLLALAAAVFASFALASFAADNAPEFVKTVYQQSRGYNTFVFKSAVFGVQGCTFG